MGLCEMAMCTRCLNVVTAVLTSVIDDVANQRVSVFLDSLLVIVLEAFHFDYKSFEEQMGNVTSEESTFETLLNLILTLLWVTCWQNTLLFLLFVVRSSY